MRSQRAQGSGHAPCRRAESASGVESKRSTLGLQGPHHACCHLRTQERARLGWWQPYALDGEFGSGASTGALLRPFGKQK